ncbi:carbamoyltransferase [Kitasatospora sp. MAP12-15]|uniref:carbamoyltransferase N-terminal domain-containing protein n=1 Tax=unclassified Kitasatospora TaxID=2633591 RepID=UPI0024743011|nr:carbamoyltransferase N-terminal domain-containing protein [Kitasatospora sp. MAP12-44]MDH6115454.1 carbamoyltransferase [Kitasatospora sp. MAP12-44]
MLICGIKVTHDGGVAVIEDGQLRFSTEVEKLGNGERYSSLGDLERVTEILRSEGLEPADVDQFVVDGWFTGDDSEQVVSTEPSRIRTLSGGRPLELTVAPYHDRVGVGDPIARHTFGDHDFGAPGSGYASYHHVSNHLLGAYCSSPFAARGEDALVLVWDGGMAPRLYRVEAATRTVAWVDTLFPLAGSTFSDFSSQFEPFIRNTDGLTPDEAMRSDLSIAGKAMAYAALGKVEESAFPVFDTILADFRDAPSNDTKDVGRKVAANRDELFPGLTNADLIATFQAYVGNLVLERMRSLVQRGSRVSRPNLVLGGGCALNIKWNSALRGSGLFREIWIPPFPNDSGAAIGTASCEMFRREQRIALDWNVYSGPRVAVGDVPAGWHPTPCDERQLAGLLHHRGEPVVVLSGRAEIGPRALGNRSILAPATSLAVKDRLNAIKDRASYRPVAPICLTSRAAEVFTPGGSDPYMLFEHRTRAGWTERIPAVLHLDGTARLQTIDASTDTATSRILTAYEEISGIPVLCNTSANLNGSGFFPDVASAARWGGTHYIWSDGTLWTGPAAGATGT